MIPKKILFCTDFSENSDPPRRLAVEYARTFGASLAIVHVVEAWAGFPAYEFRVPVDWKGMTNDLTESVKADLDEMVEQHASEISDIQTYCRTGKAPQEIVKLATELGVDLIILGTRGWTGFKHLLLGSVAENVLRLATCPVLVVKTPGQNGQTSE